MKKFMSLLLVLAMMLSLVACGGAPEEPEDSVYKSDIQEYIREFLDSSASITIFEKTDSEIDEDKLTVTCVAMFEGDAGNNKGDFTLTYSADGKDWVLDKCRVELDEEQNADTEKEDEEEGEEEQAEVEETVPETAAPQAEELALSDDWKDFTIELAGVVYQLPCSYQTFVDNGWSIAKNSYSDVQEEDMVGGYSRAYVYLTNGAVKISADLINMSGNARQAKDCNIGGITVQANDNLGLTLAQGITCTSTKEEVEAAYGIATSCNTYTDYSSIDYEIDTYNEIHFYIYTTDTTYNEITVRNFVAVEGDETTISPDRPAYLDEYVAPTALSSTVTDTQFRLFDVYYQLPCNLEAFLDNGWTIKSDSIGSLGAYNSAYGMTLTQNDIDIYLTLTNFSDLQVASKHCAVTEVEFDTGEFDDVAWGDLVFAGSISITTAFSEIESLCSSFERYDGTSSVSLTAEDDDYSWQVKYYEYIYNDEKTLYVTMMNENWDY